MAGELRATILATLKGDAAEKLAKQLDGVAGKMEKFGSIAGKAVKGVASLGAALVSSKFIGDSIEQAKNLERSILALDSVFGSTAPRMVEFSKNAAEMGLSQSEAAKASTFLGSVLQQYGFSADDAAVETEKLTKLSADLAATYGYDVQEALLAVTALFRGEYDPIEKFGVAMKQNEINAVRTARGLGDLTGAAQMQADAQIRLELLMQRSTSAQGAMERGAGTLYVETEKLRATFENLQANLGQELIPVFAELFEKLRPIIEDAGPGLVKVFEFVAEVIQFLADTLVELFDPTTELGEEFMMLGNQFESLFQTIFGRDFNLAAIFDGAKWALDLFMRALHDLIRIVENVFISFQAVGTVIHAAFTGDWASVAGKGIKGVAEEMYAARDAAIEYANTLDPLYDKAKKSLEAVGDQTEVWDGITKAAQAAGLKGGEQYGDGVGKGLKVEKDAIAEFWNGLYEEIEKQSARMKLEALGASEGLVGAILGAGQDWQKVFDSIVSGGLEAVKKAQAVFNRTAEGIKEVEEATKKAQEQIQKLLDLEISRAREMASANQEASVYYEAYARMLEGGFEKELAIQVAREEFADSILIKNNELIAQQAVLAKAFDSTATEIFEAFARGDAAEEVGEYTQAIRSLRDELVGLIEENVFDDSTGLFSTENQAQLVRSVESVTAMMERVSTARDKISSDLASAQASLQQQMEGKQSLMESVVDSLMGGVNITQIEADAQSIIDSLTRTYIDTMRLQKNIDKLREMGLQENLIDQIIASGAQVGGATAAALVQGGSGVIKTVNSLFGSIQRISESIGAKTASAMYDSGIQTTQGLVDGLLSQADQLERAAETLATKFQRAFMQAVSGGSIGIGGPEYSGIMSQMTSSGALGALVSGAAGPTYSSPSSSAVNITINAGVGTDPIRLGREVTKAIKRYETTGGRIVTTRQS